MYLDTTHSWVLKGFAISSEPSTGLRSVIVGPRRTVKPSERVWGSGSAQFVSLWLIFFNNSLSPYRESPPRLHQVLDSATDRIP